MNYAQLAEGATNLIIEFIKTNVSAQLDIVGSSVGLPQVSLENPKSYFTYDQPQVYECPAVFVIIDDQDFQIQERKPNSINAADRFNIAIAVEDQDADRVTTKAWRYLSALYQVLNNSRMTSSDGSLVLSCVVYRSKFSQVYTRKEGEGSFRKEIMLECNVTHLENF